MPTTDTARWQAIRALVEQWRERRMSLKKYSQDNLAKNGAANAEHSARLDCRAEAIRRCADELDALLTAAPQEHLCTYRDQLEAEKLRNVALQESIEGCTRRVIELTKRPATPRGDLLAALTDLTQEQAQLRDTNTRLNRRCQIAEAAANLKVEEWDKRSKRAGRAYIFELGKRVAESEIADLQRRLTASEARVTALEKKA